MEQAAATQSVGLLARVPALRQFALLVGLAASVAAGVAIVMWAQKPGYQLLFGDLNERDVLEVVQSLQAAGIDHQVNTRSGAVMVVPDQIDEARLKLAAEGLPGGSAMGVEMIQEESGFAVSQFMEGARYQHVLETELARTIVKLRPVESARVHLAIPQQSVFLRDRRPPSASVLLHLHSGRRLEPQQVASVVQLVASSIPDLQASQVTVVDHMGQLLNSPGDDSELAVSDRQFQQKRRLESEYSTRIREMLAPILGPGRVRASVVAEMDFTVSERTEELYDPANGVVRSEQVNSEMHRGPQSSPGGIPGALSNQPPPDPPAEQAGQENAGDGMPVDGEEDKEPQRESRQSTRNYEINRTVVHTRSPVGTISRLSVAVLVDHHQATGEDGEVSTEPLSETQIAEVRELVTQIVGLDEARGDTISVINASFLAVPPVEPLPEASLMERSWVKDSIRQVAAVVVLILLVFGVIRPMTGKIADGIRDAGSQQIAVEVLGGEGPGGHAPRPQLSYEERVSAARSLANQNPERVAQIVKGWVSSDG